MPVAHALGAVTPAESSARLLPGCCLRFFPPACTGGKGTGVGRGAGRAGVQLRGPAGGGGKASPRQNASKR